MAAEPYEIEPGPDSPGAAWDMAGDPNGIVGAGAADSYQEVFPWLGDDVLYCHNPRRRNAKSRCQQCFGAVRVRPISELLRLISRAPEDSRPEPPRPGFLARIRAEFRRDDEVQDAIPCPVCDPEEWREWMQDLIGECPEVQKHQRESA